MSNTEFNRLKLKTDQLYLPLSGGKVNGETIFTDKVTFGTGKKTIKIHDGIIEGLDFPEGLLLGTCDTAAATAAKVVTLTDVTDFELTKGVTIVVKSTNTSTAQNPTLNVNNTGAKSVYYASSVVTNVSLWAAGVANRYTTYVYDGTNWVWISFGVDNNTTYSAISISELTTGTATTSRVVRADYLKSAILDLANPIGAVIESTTCDTMAKVVAAYGGTTWIQHSGYFLRGATSGVVANQASNDGGADSVTVSSVASHNHSQNAHGHGLNKGTNNTSIPNVLGPVTSSPQRGNYYPQGANWGANNSNMGFTTIANATAGNNANGANYTVNTLPKYKNVYIWERTA